MSHRILIVGGGFGGVAAALHLHKQRLPDTEIILISDKPVLEYYGVLYRILSGGNASEARVPLSMIFRGTSVRLIQDRVVSVDPQKKIVTGASKKTESYDMLILSPGSEPAYFNIPGMADLSLGMKSVAQAEELRRHIHKHVEWLQKPSKIKPHIVVIGGGPTGIEVAGELLPYARKIAREQGIDPSLVTVDLIEAMDRLLPVMPEGVSAAVLRRMRSLGVNVLLKTAVASVEEGIVKLKEGEDIAACTVIWTAGLKPSSLIGQIDGLVLDKRGRVIVDEQLRAQGHTDIFAIADVASTPYSGMAQTAVGDGTFVARVIAAALRSQVLPVYKPVAPAYAIPAGPYWAAVKFGPLKVYGFLGWLLRRAADIHVFMLILPFWRVPQAFFGKLKGE